MMNITIKLNNGKEITSEHLEDLDSWTLPSLDSVTDDELIEFFEKLHEITHSEEFQEYRCGFLDNG